MTLEEAKKLHDALQTEGNAIRAKIHETTENARKLNEINHTLMEQRKSVISKLTELSAMIRDMEAEENRKKLEEAKA